MFQGFISEHQDQLKGYVNIKELNKAIFNSSVGGLFIGVLVAIIGNVVAHADTIFPNPTTSGLAVMVFGMIASQLRSMTFGKTVLPVQGGTPVVLPANAPVVLQDPATATLGPSAASSGMGLASVNRDETIAEEVSIDGKLWFRDPWTGAAFETLAAFHAWADAGHKLNEVPGGWFIDDSKGFVYTSKSGEPIHYETRTDVASAPGTDVRKSEENRTGRYYGNDPAPGYHLYAGQDPDARK